MSLVAALRRTCVDFLCAVQFLTRIPVPSLPYEADSLSRSAKFFPVVGALIGGGAALLHRAIAPHLPRLLTALFVVVYLVLITGALHEDGLADSADAFGGGTSREQILVILRDSRIGSYGAAALALSLVARILLLASLPVTEVAQYLIVAHLLCRWTTLPLSCFLSSPRTDGQGVRLARLTSLSTLAVGTLFAFAVSIFLLRLRAIAPIVSALVIVLLSALYYRRRIGGVTGDCFGATNQLSEIGIYLCGVWTA
jgi:adenosylcobinamide-GDP ribazoletransferase